MDLLNFTSCFKPLSWTHRFKIALFKKQLEKRILGDVGPLWSDIQLKRELTRMRPTHTVSWQKQWKPEVPTVIISQLGDLTSKFYEVWGQRSTLGWSSVFTAMSFASWDPMNSAYLTSNAGSFSHLCKWKIETWRGIFLF